MGIAQCTPTAAPLSCPEAVACITAQPTGTPAVAGDLVLGGDGQFHALPASSSTGAAGGDLLGSYPNPTLNPASVAALLAAMTPAQIASFTVPVMANDGVTVLGRWFQA